jgi:hypothetical protein
MVRWLPIALLLSLALPAQPRVTVTFPPARSAQPLDGRLLVILTRRAAPEPRLQISDGPGCAQIFGIDVDGWTPGAPATIDARVFGHPLPSLADVPAGDYVVQALLHRYETFRRGDGHVVKMPMDRGEGQQWNKAPGNLLSTPRTARLAPDSAIEIVLDQEIPPIAPPQDTRYIKHLKIQSELLTAFWGRPMHLGAVVLLPHGFAQHPDARYPLVVNHGHFPHTFEGFRETPPDPDLAPDHSERFRLHGYNRIQQEQAYELYRTWTGPDFPRFLVLQIQHANPFYDDSYAVDSQNVGPYGEAIMRELIPHVEETFRGIGQGWARFTYGGSTGGWEALAAQVLYPDEFNGCFAACPDPIDFSAYTVVDIYQDRNAYWLEGDFARVPRPGKRDHLGRTSATLEQMNHLELVLGTKSRSGQQWDIWEAVFSPVGKDGYPQRIWDKRTGAIDAAVAAHWREHYDLGHILRRDWATLGPKLAGKIHLYCGTLDNYFLEIAVYKVEEFLRAATNPPSGAEIAYGERAEHCWNGDPTRPNAISRLRYHVMYVEKMLGRMLQTAPAGADLKSWRY